MEYLTVVIETKNRTLEETAALFDGDDARNVIIGHRAPETPESNMKDGEKSSDPSDKISLGVSKA